MGVQKLLTTLKRLKQAGATFALSKMDLGGFIWETAGGILWLCILHQAYGTDNAPGEIRPI